MVLAFVNTFSHPRKLVTAALAARTSIFRLSNARSASSGGIRIPGVSEILFEQKNIYTFNACTVQQ